jgi:hypothetical protein
MKHIFCIFLLIISFNVFAQKRQNAIFVEVKGTGVNLTLNYDTRLSFKKNGLGARIGIGSFGNKYSSVINLPIELNYLFGNEKHFFETSIGTVWGNYIEESDDRKGFADLYITPLQGWAFCIGTGYRYQKAGKILFRINFTPLFTRNKIYSLAGTSMGYSF